MTGAVRDAAALIVSVFTLVICIAELAGQKAAATGLLLMLVLIYMLVYMLV